MIQYLAIIDSPEDHSKFEKLYNQYRGLMYRKAFEILHNVQDAEDAVHQAFVNIAENIETIDDAIAPRTKGLVVTIVRHIAIDMYRKKRRRESMELQDIWGITIEYDGKNTIAACMATLPENYRDALILKYHYGFSSKETARLLGMSEANVIKTSQRAKKKLEVLLKEEGIL